MTNLNNNFDFFNYKLIKRTTEEQRKINAKTVKIVTNNLEREERRIRRERYNKALTIQLG